MMNKKPTEAIAQGNDIELCRIVIGPAFRIRPAGETTITPEPDLKEVEHLYSKKPLRFNRSVLS